MTVTSTLGGPSRSYGCRSRPGMGSDPHSGRGRRPSSRAGSGCGRAPARRATSTSPYSGERPSVTSCSARARPRSPPSSRTSLATSPSSDDTARTTGTLYNGRNEWHAPGRALDLGTDHVERPRQARAVGRVEQPPPCTHDRLDRELSATPLRSDRRACRLLDSTSTPTRTISVRQHGRGGHGQGRADRQVVDQPVHADREHHRHGEASLGRDGALRRHARERMIRAENPARAGALLICAHRVRSTAEGGALELPTRGLRPTSPCSHSPSGILTRAGPPVNGSRSPFRLRSQEGRPLPRAAAACPRGSGRPPPPTRGRRGRSAANGFPRPDCSAPRPARQQLRDQFVAVAAVIERRKERAVGPYSMRRR